MIKIQYKNTKIIIVNYSTFQRVGVFGVGVGIGSLFNVTKC